MSQNLEIKTIMAKSSNFGRQRPVDNIKYIVVHFTANNGDRAIDNGNYFAKNNTGTSAHYFVDENEIIRSVKDDYVAYHCGGVKYFHLYCRNSNSIGVELCSRKKKGVYYIKEEVIERGINLIKMLMKKYNISVDNVVRHYDVTHKNCPAPFVENPILWTKFKNRLVDNSLEEDSEVVETGNITINGKDIKIDKIVKDGTTFIKLRGLENAGFNVDYNKETKALTLNNQIRNIRVEVDGEDKTVNSININGKNYIHIRALEELFEDVDVDYLDNKIILNTIK